MKRSKNSNSLNITKPKESIDLFSNSRGNIFDFSKDAIKKVKVSNKLPEDISFWNNKNFIDYLKNKIEDYMAGTSAYDSKTINKIRDTLTLSYQQIEKNNELQSDNVMLKKYFDWWIESNLSYYVAKKSNITIGLLAYEKNVHEFFNTTLWNPSKTHSGKAGETISTKTYQNSPQNNWSDLYKAGGLNRLIFDAGVVDSFYYLISQKNKSHENATKELRTTLKSLHDAVFTHVIHKTMNKIPYAIEKKFDIETILKPIIKSRGLDIELQSINYGSFFKEGE